MLIISMMIDNVKVCCGFDCTTFIINDVIYTCDRLNLIPKKQVFNGGTIGKISYGEKYAIFIEKSGETIYGRGSNDMGQLGLRDNNNRTTPQKIMFDFESRIRSIDCGMYYTMIVTEYGEMYGWGYNNIGQLGLGDKINRNFPHKLPIEDVIQVSCGTAHTIILTKIGCFACGLGTSGQLGLGDLNIGFICVPEKLNLPDLISISCGGYHTFALSPHGVYSWGLNCSGQLGLGNHTYSCYSYCAPIRNDLLDLCVVSISCGSYHTMLLTFEGELFACGSNNGGQLGLGNNECLFTFQKINLNETILSVNCGSDHTIVVTNSGKYYGWGCNWHGQLGLGDTTNRSEPTEIVIKI